MLKGTVHLQAQMAARGHQFLNSLKALVQQKPTAAETFLLLK